MSLTIPSPRFMISKQQSVVTLSYIVFIFLSLVVSFFWYLSRFLSRNHMQMVYAKWYSFKNVTTLYLLRISSGLFFPNKNIPEISRLNTWLNSVFPTLTFLAAENFRIIFITNLIIVTSIQVIKPICITSKMAIKVPFYDYDLVIRKLTSNLINLTLAAPCISESCIKIKI